MLISWKWLQNLVETGDLSAEEAARKLTARGLEVEGMTLDPTCIRDIKVARMVRIVDHPNSDHLHLVEADVGEAELVRVVCGAPAFRKAGSCRLRLSVPKSAISKLKNRNFAAKNPSVCCAAKSN